MSGEILRVIELGCVRYREARELMDRFAADRLAGSIPDSLLLLEHPPTITLGRGADRNHLLASERELTDLGCDVVETDRGGDVTYHGPGQLVGYPILDLKASPHRPDLHWYLRQIETALIAALDEFGIPADRFQNHTGVWTSVGGPSPEKIAAIGIRVSRWITQHGFALNVSTRLEDFKTIVPCGIKDFGVTSMAATLGRQIEVETVKPIVASSFARTFDLSVEQT